MQRTRCPLPVAFLGALLLTACAGAYKEAVASRVATLPQESARLYKGCVVKPCSVLIPDLAMQEIEANAQLACLVDTDKGAKEKDVASCQCSQAANDDARKTACERWMAYTASAPTPSPSSSSVGPAASGAPDHNN